VVDRGSNMIMKFDQPGRVRWLEPEAESVSLEGRAGWWGRGGQGCDRRGD